MRFSRQVVIAIASAAVVASVISFVAPSAYAAWTTTAAGTFSQSVPSTAVPGIGGYLTCITDKAANSAELTWTDSPATFDGMPFLGYYIEWNYSTGTKASVLTATRTGAYATPTSSTLTGSTVIHVTAEYGTATNIWKSAVSADYAFTRSTTNGPVCSPEDSKA